MGEQLVRFETRCRNKVSGILCALLPNSIDLQWIDRGFDRLICRANGLSTAFGTPSAHRRHHRDEEYRISNEEYRNLKFPDPSLRRAIPFRHSEFLVRYSIFHALQIASTLGTRCQACVRHVSVPRLSLCDHSSAFSRSACVSLPSRSTSR